MKTVTGLERAIDRIFQMRKELDLLAADIASQLPPREVKRKCKLVIPDELKKQRCAK